MLRWVLLLVLLSTSALASRADRLSVSPRLDRRDRLGATAAAPNPILLSLSLLPPDSECSGTPPDGVTFTRASAATCIDSSGVAHALATNEARVHSTLGLLVEGSATNAVLHSRDVTAAPWIGTGCAKTGIGMDGFTSVGRCTGATSAIQILTVATGARTASAYVRRQSGTCSVTLSADSESVVKNLVGGWERVVLPYTSDGSVSVSISVNSGCVADIDYVQDEASSIATSPIVTTGTAAVRAAEIATLTPPEVIDPVGCVGVDMAPLWTGNVPIASTFISGGGTSNRLGYANANVNTWVAFGGSGSGPATVAAGFVSLVPRTYVTSWSVAGSALTVTNASDAATSSSSFAGWGAALSAIWVGGHGATARANAHLRNLVLGATPEACQ